MTPELREEGILRRRYQPQQDDVVQTEHRLLLSALLISAAGGELINLPSINQTKCICSEKVFAWQVVVVDKSKDQWTLQREDGQSLFAPFPHLCYYCNF